MGAIREHGPTSIPFQYREEYRRYPRVASCCFKLGLRASHSGFRHEGGLFLSICLRKSIRDSSSMQNILVGRALVTSWNTTSTFASRASRVSFHKTYLSLQLKRETTLSRKWPGLTMLSPSKSGQDGGWTKGRLAKNCARRQCSCRRCGSGEVAGLRIA